MPKPIPTPPPSIDNQLTSASVFTRPVDESGRYGRKQEIGKPRWDLPKERIGVEYDNQCFETYSYNLCACSMFDENCFTMHNQSKSSELGANGINNAIQKLINHNYIISDIHDVSGNDILE